MLNVLAILLALGQGSTRSIPATDVAASDLERAVELMKTSGVTDTPVRTVDAGGHHVGVAVVYRRAATDVVAGTIHTEVTEDYSILEGSEYS